MSDKLISVILLLTSAESGRIQSYLDEVIGGIPSDFGHRQIIMVQDGGVPVEESRLNHVLSQYEGVRYILLSQPSGLSMALSAGLEAAIGDYCVTLVPSTDPIESIGKLIHQCESENALVIGQRSNPKREGGWVFQISKSCFHFLADRVVGLDFPKNTTFMTCMSRHSLNYINQAADRERFIRALTSHIGLKVATFSYDPRVGAAPIRSFKDSVYLSLDILCMNTVNPLRFLTFGAALAVGLNILGAVVVAALLFKVKNSDSRGWMILSLQISLVMSGFFVGLALISEYLRRLLLETRDRPNFIVLKDLNSVGRVNNLNRPNVIGMQGVLKK